MALINTLKISAAQVKLCVAIIDYFKAKKKDADGNEISEEVRERWNKGLFRRVELREAHKILADREACPYFIT
jgi:hypothetical protein